MPALALSGCLTPKQIETGDTSGGGGDNSGSGNGNGGGSGTTIFDVRDGSVAIGESVTITGAVVTSPHTFGDEGFFIQDPAGGPKSGLYVWSASGVAGVYAEEGDEVTVTGSVSDYYGWTELVIGSPTDVTITGSADVPAPVELDSGSGVNWDDYESVLVRLKNQTVDSVNEYGTGLLSSGINVDNGFVNLDYSCRGTYDELQGIIFYSYKEWSINARTQDDAGTFTDGEAVDSTIHDVQMGSTCGPVRLTDVVATSPSWDDNGDTYFFVQDAGGGEYSGLTAYVKGASYDVATGDKITLVGDVSEFYGLTEVTVKDTSDISTNGTGTPVVTELDAAPSDWEPYESCLVKLNNVTATCDDPAGNYGQCLTDWGITVDNVFFDYAWSKNVVWDSITGPVFYSYSTWTVEPRDESDVVEN